MLKLIILEDSSKANLGGGQKVTLEVLDALSDCTIVEVADCNLKTSFARQVKRKGIKLNKLLCFSSKQKIKKQSFNVGFLEILSTFILSPINALLLWPKKYNLAYTTTKKALLVAYFMKKFFGTPYVYHAHLIENKNSILFKLMLPAFKNANKIICVSYAVKNSLDFENSVVIYNPAPEIKCTKNKTNDTFKIASLSAYTYTKGVLDLAESAKILNSQNINFEIHFYGKGELEDKLKQYFEHNVFVHSFTDNINNVLCDADLLVLPSRISEALPLSIMEAFAAGVPVVTTNLGGQAELIEKSKAGILVEPGNPKALAEAIAKLQKNKLLYSSFSKNALDFAKMYNKGKFKKEIQNLICKYENPSNK